MVFPTTMQYGRIPSASVVLLVKVKRKSLALMVVKATPA